MTMPDERASAILRTERFLLDLMNPKKTPGIPRAIRDRASSCLRHYPAKFYVEHLAMASPGILEFKERPPLVIERETSMRLKESL